MKANLFFSLFLTLSLTTIGCGSSSTSTSSSSGNDSEESGSGGSVAALNTVADLPSSTDAVTDGSGANASIAALGSSEEGMPLGEITADDFDANSAHAACEMFNMTKTAINQAAQGDLIQCYITSTFDAFADGEGIDIYDGEYHVFALDFSGSSFEEQDEEEGNGGGGPSLIKFKIEKDENDVITSFEMFACGDNGESDEQSMYLLQEIDGTDFSMNVVNIGGDGDDWTFADDVTVTGTLSEDGAFVDEVDGVATPKRILMSHSGGSQSRGEDFWGVMDFRQSADSATMTGTFSGSNSFQNQSCQFTTVLSGSADMIDGNEEGSDSYEIGLLELGDGAVKVLNQGSCEGDQEGWEDTNSQAWSGATATALEGDDRDNLAHYQEVIDDELTASEDPSDDIAFGENAYDCDEEPEATVVFADLDVDVALACSDLELSHNHIDCWHIIGDQYDQE